MRSGWARRSQRRIAALTTATLVASAAIVFAAPQESSGVPQSRLGVRTAPVLLLSREEVRTDLRLTAAQSKAAEREIESLYSKAASLKGKAGPEVERERRKIDDAQQHWLRTNLSSEQLERLTQIDLQWEGPSALVSRPAVAKILNLSESQRGLIQAALARRRADYGRGPEETQMRAESVLAQETLAALRPEQKDRWFLLLGRPCAFRSGSVAKTAVEAPQTNSIRR
jgi:hypothetical protein